MPLKAFKRGGIHPKDSKYTGGYAITNADIPKKVRIPMAMHIGAPAKVVVKEGDVVEEGQLIGEAAGFVSANIHASVSGKVVSVAKGNTLTVRGVDFVTIETGGSIKNWYESKQDYSSLSAEELLGKVKNAGIVGMGGATFPTHVKLSPPKDKTIHAIIVNAAECEPYLTADHRLMLEKTAEIFEGLKIVAKILKPHLTYIGIEANKPDAIKVMSETASGKENIEVISLRTRYPQGGEKQLIEAVVGRQVPTKGLPADVGVVVLNVGTVFAIYEAVVYGKPLIERIMTFSGEDVEKCGNYKVRIGHTFEEFTDEYDLPTERGALIAGGPMMGLEINDLSLPIIKGSSGLVVIPPVCNYDVEQNPCIRCSKCTMVCPIGLQPFLISKLSDKMRVDDAANEGLMDCIECGSCAYVCPSTIPLVGLIRYGKSVLRRKMAKK